MDTENQKSKINIRELALNALIMINEEGVHSSTVIKDALDKYTRIDSRDRALFVKLIHGSLEYQIQSDAIINRYSNTKVQKMKPMVRNLLRMSVYQILYMDKIPDSAVCDEAVKLIKKSALRNLGGFVNGVLRNISREKENLSFSGSEEAYSVQKWMYDLMIETIGKEKTDSFLDYSLSEHGITVREVGTENMRILEGVGNITELEGWKEGKIIVQDLSASMPIRYADINKGATVIDVCAAPGGKSIQASEKVGHDGLVWACDLTEKKLERIHENLKRLKIDNVKTLVQDATIYKAEFDSLADVVIADLPCSGIGTISKKPEIKNRLSIEDCRTLAGIQKSILNNVCRYVKPGGKLVYSTCTLDHLENEDNTKAFLDTHSDFDLVTENVLLPDDVPQDGFYLAVMIKR